MPDRIRISIPIGMGLFKKKRPSVLSVDFDQEEDRGGYWGTSPDRPKVGEVVIVIPQEDFPNTLERAWWGNLVEIVDSKSRWLRFMYRVTLIEPLAPQQTNPIAAAYFQTVDSTPREEREMALQHPEAWADGVRKAEEVCRGKKISALDKAQLRYAADIELTREPGTEEATVFITAFVRKAEEMIESGEAS